MTTLKNIKGVGDKILQKLNELGVFSIKDLVHFLPNTYIDMNNMVNITEETEAGYGMVIANVVSTKKSAGYGHKQYFKVTAYYEDTLISIVWYNMPYLSSSIKKGENYKFFGKIIRNNQVFEMINPLYELESKSVKLVGIIPIYRTKGLIPQGTMRSIINNALSIYEGNSLRELIAIAHGELADKVYYNNLVSIHNPTNLDEINEKIDMLIEDELASKILSYRLIRQSVFQKKHSYCKDYLEIEEFIDCLPYKLTDSQINAKYIIINDLDGSSSMNRLLSGDVGSGKTIVAIIAMLYASTKGNQVAYMAPTEILARQVYELASKLLPMRRIAILTSSVKATYARRVKEEIENGQIDIVIATTSILNESIEFSNLTFAIIDESHRFGVANRSAIEHKGNYIDTLIMTATPIPRSLSMIMYGELEDTFIERRSKLKDKISTVLIKDDNELMRAIIREVSLGHQAYIVCPMIEDNEGVELYSAKGVLEQLQKGALKGLKLALLHGKMDNETKNAVMSSFYKGEVDVLVSTTVIEVGIDVPNATVMGILNSERFGLATLHQIRGRVGRGECQSYCYLVTNNINNQRLSAFCECYDGREVAELDLTIRGTGEYLGVRQSGLGDSFVLGKSVSKDDVIRAREFADSLYKDREFLSLFANSEQFNIDKKLYKITMN